MQHRSFDQFGPAPSAGMPTGPFAGPPASPIVISVPHAGRHYPAALLDALQGAAATLRPLEDRHVDAVALAARGDETMLVQRYARAWIDLNRTEHERDPQVDEGAPQIAMTAMSAKLRGGLGLVARRASGTQDLWTRRFTDADVVARIAEVHRPYHAALATALDRARARFGIAVLLDVHSMPPLLRGDARIVLGDRFGHAAAPRLVARLESAARAARVPVARNIPYAGGHILERHARPDAGVHAIQVEFDRSLYLDRRLDGPGPGLARTAALLRAMLDALADEAGAMTFPAAAE